MNGDSRGNVDGSVREHEFITAQNYKLLLAIDRCLEMESKYLFIVDILLTIAAED